MIVQCAAMSHRLLAVAALFILFAVACEPKENDKCLTQDDCGSALFCIDSRCFTQESANKRCKTGARFSGACEKNGACTWSGDKCAPANVADCEQSKGCTADAHCTFDGDHGCVLASEADCQKSEFCTKLKRCRYDEKVKKCMPGNDAECAAQSDCKLAAACTFDKATGRCTPSEADCKASGMCEGLGLCALDAEKKKCVPGSEDDCKKNPDCKAGGKCAYDEASKKCVEGGDDK